MRSQRVGLGWKPTEMQLIKWTAEGLVKGFAEYSKTCWLTLVAGNMFVFRRVRFNAKSRWHHGNLLLSSLTVTEVIVRGVLFSC